MSIPDRIKEVRTKMGLTQTEFGEKIGVKGNTITGYETGLRTPGTAILTSISREFGVDPIWLETGEGEPFRPLSVKEQLADIFGDVLSGNPTVKNKFIEAVSLLPEDAYPVIVQSILDIADHLKHEE